MLTRTKRTLRPSNCTFQTLQSRMTTQQLETHIQSTSIPAVNSTEVVKAEDGSEFVLVEFSGATFTGVDSSDDIGLL